MSEDRAVPPGRRLAVALLGAAAVTGVAWLDGRTGRGLSFSLCYLLAVSAGAWYGGVRTGVGLALLSATLWTVTEPEPWARPWVAVWNALMRLGTCGLAVAWLARIRAALEVERRAATMDPLTAAANHRAFGQRLERELLRSRRTHRPFGVAYIDLDGFKAVNDTRGHAVGDRLLVDSAAALMGAVRAIDTAARLGGDEFAVLLPETDASGLRTCVSGLRAALMAVGAASDPPVTPSIGALCVDRAVDAAEVIRAADRLMYAAKRAGPGQVRFGALSDD